ncbi:uncharacterized protein [Porites lutea]|uniref:uncharacterized protein n=1 Tax=Porites lutea TaxID=51062 RepID=UPI003CC64378
MCSSLFTWFLLFKVLLSVLAETAYTQGLDSGFRQDFFMQDDHHYLNVPRLETFTVSDKLACNINCLRNPSCLSVNLAAIETAADEKIWCELLSSEKNSNPEKYKRNKTSHHLSSFLKTSCVSSPCRNGGTCVSSFNHHTFYCNCREGFVGVSCEVAIKSCQDLYHFEPQKLNQSQVVTVIFDSRPTQILCHMGDFGCGDGGWTPVMKMNGSKQTFHYDASLWRNNETFNLDGGKTGFDSQETKLPSYWNTSFSKICLGMKIGQQISFIVINRSASSLHSLIADGQFRATSLGRDTWKLLIGPEASLQVGCNKEGFNSHVVGRIHSKARIGIISNQENHCNSCDSRIGFGTGGLHDDTNSCGNQATHSLCDKRNFCFSPEKKNALIE